jgi:Recombinase
MPLVAGEPQRMVTSKPSGVSSRSSTLSATSSDRHNAIAQKLNERNVRTARGGRWTHMQVGAIMT